MRVESVLGSVLECVPCARVSNQIIVYTSPNYWNKINSTTHSESLHSADTFFLFPLRFNVERDHPYVNLNSEKQYLRFATFEKVGGRSVDCWREFNSLQINVSVVMFLQEKI